MFQIKMDTDGKASYFVTNPEQHSLRVKFLDDSEWFIDEAFSVR